MSVLGLDIGTNGCKSIVIDQSGEILSSASRQYSLLTPQPGWVELDPRQVWSAALESMGQAINGAGSDQVQAISISAMGDTLIPCNENYSPISNSILAFDTRNIAEVKEFEEEIGRKRIFDITGQPVHPTYSIVKILWIKKYLPDLFNQTAFFLCYEDFLTAQFCGKAYISYSSAARTMAFDINKYSWNQEILDICSLNEEKFAVASPSGKPVGTIKKEIAEQLNLSGEVKVVIGGHDQPCGALGCGLFGKTTALDSTGTVEVLLVTHKEPVLTSEMLEANICFWPHVISGEYCACGQILTAGAAFRWFRDTFAELDIDFASRLDKDPYDLITSKFPSSPSELLFIPHLSGSGTPEFTPLAKGAVYGLTLQTNKYDFAKAILEGITFELKLNIELLEKAGMKIQSLKAVGGAANSETWMQLKADITGKKVNASQFANQCPLGAALLAGYGIGMFNDLKIASENCQKKIKSYRPNHEDQVSYLEKFMDYLKFRFDVFDLYERI